TNDLDLETLELLEDILLEFAGTVLLVSHDRDFMDNVVTSIIALDGQGGVSEQIGAYSDWEAGGGRIGAPQARNEAGRDNGSVAMPAPAPSVETGSPRPARRSYQQQRALDKQLREIEQLEEEQARLEAQMSEADLNTRDPATAATAAAALARLVKQLEAAYQRWSELEGS
ncbi:MAG: ABC transporter ATP-binding protein, partial [Anaerolineae bacterium]